MSKLQRSVAPSHAARHGRRSRKGFTLVELLVVIAIIGVLVALLLPAINAAREVAKRMQCSGRLKQWGVALINYESQNDVFPYGTIRGPDVSGDLYGASSAGPAGETRQQTFVLGLWPYLEMTTLYDEYRFDMNFYHVENRQYVAQQNSMYFCPSDRRGMWKIPDDSDHERSRGNYVVNFGSGSYYQQSDEWYYRPAPFGANFQTNTAEMRDGATNTMLMCEVIQATEDGFMDYRGDFFNDAPGAAQFMTINPPNDGVDSMRCDQGGTRPGPCEPNESFVIVSARSYHPGGVMAVFADAATHFISDTVDSSNPLEWTGSQQEYRPGAWQAFGSAAGGEVVNDYPF